MTKVFVSNLLEIKVPKCSISH